MLGEAIGQSSQQSHGWSVAQGGVRSQGELGGMPDISAVGGGGVLGVLDGLRLVGSPSALWWYGGLSV